MEKLQSFLEFQVFGVCTQLGEKLGIASSRVRMFFIYASFLTMGSPVIAYLILAWWWDFRKHLRLQRNLLKDF